MRRLLLVSTSTTHGTAYLEHCGPQVLNLFHGAGVEHILFVPFALHDRDAYAARAEAAFLEMGLGLESIHRAADPISAIEKANGLFIGGGNTFRLLKSLYDHELIEPIRRRVLAGMPYLGTSAGSNVACPSIKTTNDMPIVRPPSFAGLALVPFQINPHYIDPDLDSTHMGETRDTRIREFHEENETAVVALREGAMLEIEDLRITLRGSPGGKIFLRGQDPKEVAEGEPIELEGTSG
jgi:dipeptidase E